MPRFDIVVITLFVVAIISFAIGRRVGIKFGFRQGVAESELNLRRKSLLNGVCPICTDKKEKGVGSENSMDGL